MIIGKTPLGSFHIIMMKAWEKSKEKKHGVEGLRVQDYQEKPFGNSCGH